MTREIKFRAWDKINKNLFIVSAIQGIDKDESSEYKFVSGRYYNVVDWEDAELMQFTGLKDKNGKEIYEGDIIETKEIKWLVEPLNSLDRDEQVYGLMVSVNGNGECFPIDKGILKGEVIGNIYEHEYLLD